MKIKTSELTGAQLDWAVAKCDHPEQYDYENGGVWVNAEAGERFQPSTDWAQGGPIIEREKIDVFWQSITGSFVGSAARGRKVGWRHLQYGPTPLIAAMRCYVASKLGDEVEVPEGLK